MNFARANVVQFIEVKRKPLQKEGQDPLKTSIIQTFMDITAKTKNLIFNEIKKRKIIYHGKLDEVDFLNRVVDMKALPSEDPRFNDMYSDLWQHRINNPTDWDEYWFFNDKRINLLSNDDTFIRFITELLSPTVRNKDEVEVLRNIIGFYLKKDGYQLVEDEQYFDPGVFTYKIVAINPTQIERSFKTNNEFIKEEYEKIDSRIRAEDYKGAVTSARSFLEFAIKDIYNQITNDSLDKIDNLQDGFKRIQKLLRLDYDKTADENIKQILRGFISIVSALAPLTNTLGDRHGSKSNANRNTAIFCTDSVKILVNFLYNRMNDLHGTFPSIHTQLIKVLDSELRLKRREVILADRHIQEIISYCDTYLTKLLIKRHIEKYQIRSFRESDIYFAFLRIYVDAISSGDLQTILNKQRNNNQAIGTEDIIKLLKMERSELFTETINSILESYIFS
ncbi:hypothetical protein A2W32_01220 [candidate division WWE3 bacterium RBG_16_37_10]|uniref:Abortive infection protein-like C-terminal domain-containing protein n=1 Tax=candidate division WWE3 bacterium RBG_16_37_10 TaxID=1802610 RepID=A0A1F4UVC4_UNCKA|nr:MAG: hypothetical protein A2W32_01220 [candidate division WWE3 bacterium RBG_16_37_10]